MNLLHKHLTAEQLTDLAEQLMPAEASRASREHLAACLQCEGKLLQLQQLISTMRADQSVDAPRDVIAYAKNLFVTAQTTTTSIVRLIVAALSFDSLTSAPAYGTRSGQTEMRQLLFSAEGNDIDLRISPQPEGWVVSGQVLGSAKGNAEAVLLGDAISTVATLNELSEFSFAPVPAGNYQLNLRLGELEVQVPELALGV